MKRVEWAKLWEKELERRDRESGAGSEVQEKEGKRQREEEEAGRGWNSTKYWISYPS